MAFRRLYRNVGLEVQTLHVCHQLNKRHGDNRYHFTADLTLRKIHGRVVIDDETYSGVEVGRPSAGPVFFDVCGCGTRELAKNSGPRDILLFLQRIKERRDPPSCHTADLSITDEMITYEDYCSWCLEQPGGRWTKKF